MKTFLCILGGAIVAVGAAFTQTEMLAKFCLPMLMLGALCILLGCSARK